MQTIYIIDMGIGFHHLVKLFARSNLKLCHGRNVANLLCNILLFKWSKIEAANENVVHMPIGVVSGK